MQTGSPVRMSLFACVRDEYDGKKGAASFEKGPFRRMPHSFGSASIERSISLSLFFAQSSGSVEGLFQEPEQ